MPTKHVPHTIKAALEITQLSEEEAYFILRFAGKLGYSKAIKQLDGNIFTRFRKWLVWFGGWETSKLRQWDNNKPAWIIFENNKLVPPTPLSFFGHLITFQNRFFKFKCFTGYFVLHYPDHNGGFGVYWSPNGTPYNEKAKIFLNQRNY